MAAGPVPAAIEYLDAGALAIAGAGFPGGMPDGGGFLVIAESDTGAADAALLAEALEPGAVGGVRVVDDPAGLWRWRDGVGLVVTAERGGKLSDDIAVPVERLAEAVGRVAEIGDHHGLPSCSWGHAGDGNLHATFLVDPRDDLAVARARHAADDLLAMAIELEGTISGEHGIGVLKNGWLSRQWSPAAVAAHVAVKNALDPAGRDEPGEEAAVAAARPQALSVSFRGPWRKPASIRSGSQRRSRRPARRRRARRDSLSVARPLVTASASASSAAAQPRVVGLDEREQARPPRST